MFQVPGICTWVMSIHEQPSKIHANNGLNHHITIIGHPARPSRIAEPPQPRFRIPGPGAVVQAATKLVVFLVTILKIELWVSRRQKNTTFKIMKNTPTTTTTTTTTPAAAATTTTTTTKKKNELTIKAKVFRKNRGISTNRSSLNI